MTVHITPSTSPWNGQPCYLLSCDVDACHQPLPTVRTEGAAKWWKRGHEAGHALPQVRYDRNPVREGLQEAVDRRD